MARLSAQQEKVAALKQSLAENQKRLRQYKWIETTTINMKGEEKSRVQKMCFYGPDGKVQKQQLTAPPPPQQGKRGLKGKIAAEKKEEITDYMKQAAALVHQYVPPDPQRIQAVAAAGDVSMSPGGPGAARLEFRNYLKAGDNLSINLDTASNAIQAMNVKSYLQSPHDPVSLNVTFARLNTGVSYPANIVLDAPAKHIQVVVQNSNYEPLAPQAQPSADRSMGAPHAPQVQPAAFQQSAGVPASPEGKQAIDSLTAPIALYPDASIAQILTASTNFDELQSFAGWMASNANLKGSDLQDAAQKAGFDAAYVALAAFPQVVQMMVQKPDWTRQLGQAFASNRTAVFDSIQRLRAEAQAAGNLKTTEQQKVETQSTSSGQQVIVIEPANPQVVYVPQYNPQTVYAPSPSYAGAAAAGAIGFTTGVIIGASSSHYYYGPYGWHGAAMYNEAWNQRENYLEQRQNTYQQNAAQRQSTYQQNATQRQSAAQTNQAQRQSAAQTGQTQAQANQAQRQSAAQTGQAQRQANQGQLSTEAQSRQTQRQSAAATSSFGGGQTASQRSGTASNSFSGYQNGSAARAESARGSSSLSASRSFGGGRRR